jgi:hypothetical protein
LPTDLFADIGIFMKLTRKRENKNDIHKQPESADAPDQEGGGCSA